MTLLPSDLKQYVRYDPETGIFTSARDSGCKGQWKAGRRIGHVNKKGYLTIWIEPRGYFAHRVAWALMTGEWPQEELDHANGIRDDNRWCNLREASHAQNMANTRRSKANKSGYKGVHRFDDNLWRASVRFNGKRYDVGLFRCPTAAFFARNAKAKELHGEFARSA